MEKSATKHNFLKIAILQILKFLKFSNSRNLTFKDIVSQSLNVTCGSGFTHFLGWNSALRVSITGKPFELFTGP